MAESMQEFTSNTDEAYYILLEQARIDSKRLEDKAYLEQIYQEGAAKAQYLANKTLRKVYKKVGFVPAK